VPGGLTHRDRCLGVTAAAITAMLQLVRPGVNLVAALAIVLAPASAMAADGETESSEVADVAPRPDVARFALGAGAHVAFGTMPATALGARVSAELATRQWSLGIEGRYEYAIEGTRTLVGTAAPTTLAGLSFVPCLRAPRAWACGVVLGGRVTKEGADPGDARFLFGAGVRFAMHLALPLDSALRFTGELLAHPFDYELFANGHRVFRSSILSMMFGPTLVHAF
jgi:hypothetical protein